MMLMRFSCLDPTTPEGVTYNTPAASPAPSPGPIAVDQPELGVDVEERQFAPVFHSTANVPSPVAPADAVDLQPEEFHFSFPPGPDITSSAPTSQQFGMLLWPDLQFNFEEFYATLPFPLDVDFRTPSPGLGFAILSPNGTSPTCDYFSFAVTSPTGGYSPLTVPSPDSDLTSGEFRFRMLFKVPWLLFRDAVNARLCQFSASLSPGGVGHGLSMEQSRMFLSGLPLQLLQVSDSNNAYTPPDHELAALLKQRLPGHLPPGGDQALSQLFRFPGRCHVSQFVELAFGLISNILPPSAVEHVLSFATQSIPRDLLQALFSIETSTVDAVVDKMLETAVSNGDDYAIRVLLDAGTNQRRLLGPRGTRLLQMAIEAGCTKTAGLLLSEGADPDPQDTLFADLEYITPLHAAVNMGHVSMVGSLLKAGAEVDRFAPDTALALAVGENDLESASLLLEAGADVNVTWVQDNFEDGSYSYDYRPIDYAFLNGHEEMYQLLLAKEIPSSVSLSGILSAAKVGAQRLKAYLGDAEQAPDDTLRRLLEKALIGALCHPDHDAVSALLDCGVDPNATHRRPLQDDDEGPSPLEIAVIMRSVCNIGRLLSAEARVTGAAIEHAVEDESLLMLHILAESGATPHLLGHYGLFKALRAHKPDAFRFLLQAGATVNDPADWKRVMRAAAAYGNLEAVKILAQNGAKEGISAMMQAASVAAECGNLETLKLLVDLGVQLTSRLWA